MQPEPQRCYMNVMIKSFAYENMHSMLASSATARETVRARLDRQYAEINAQLARIGIVLDDSEHVMDSRETR